MIKGEKTSSEILKPFVNDILVFEEENPKTTSTMPFFPDGYPGIVFNVAPNGLYLKHKAKKLSEFFLYGQTIHPIEIFVQGKYKMIVFQMFPFAVRTLLGIEPKTLNDECYDLTGKFKQNLDLNKLKEVDKSKTQIKIISEVLDSMIKKSPLYPDNSILLAIHIILQYKGKISVADLREKLHVSERTLERRFVREIGVTPKLFCKIIQFQNALAQITNESNYRLTRIAYENGFSDQSHFIKTFKKYTGLTPSQFQHLPAVANFIIETD